MDDHFSYVFFRSVCKDGATIDTMVNLKRARVSDKSDGHAISTRVNAMRDAAAKRNSNSLPTIQFPGHTVTSHHDDTITPINKADDLFEPMAKELFPYMKINPPRARRFDSDT